ncbi:MAG: cation diffusion facilitator family transporter [Alistipes sp.]|jgi:cation diffusion facilitator family transporter|nr:cation diffusion facilitator family transporter [Alistipes sp.]
MSEQKKEKDRALVRTSWISVAGNALLSAAKIAVGVAAGSMAVLGDGIDSATDVVVSVVMLVAAFVIARPPSRRYPFGLDKAECVATLVLSLVIVFAGVQMLISSVGIIVSGETRPLPGTLALWVTVASIGGKLALAWYQFRVGRRTGSSLIIANAKNMRNDVLISVGVLAGLFFTFVLKLPILDAITGCVISLFIAKVGVGIFLESAFDLLDGVKDEAVYRKIFEAVESVPEARNPHHVRLRLVGGRYMIDLDIEVASDMTVARAHDIADRVEEGICAAVGNVYDVEVHIEPSGACHDREPFGVHPEMLNGR